MAFYLHGVEVKIGAIAKDESGKEWECHRLEHPPYDGSWPFAFKAVGDCKWGWFHKNGHSDGEIGDELVNLGKPYYPAKELPKVRATKSPTELELEALKVRMGKLETLKGFEAEVKKLTTALKEARAKTIALKAELYKGKKGK